jgi:hypothetical protein
MAPAVGSRLDSGHHLHPDERFLTMVATDVRMPSSASVYFDTGRSPLNPANVGRAYFTYGTFPLFLTRAVAAALVQRITTTSILSGGVGGAPFDLGTILVAYRIALLLAGSEAALVAAAFLSFSVVSIQHAHFFTVDAFATFFATVTMLMLVYVSLGRGLIFHVLFGVALGLTLACRINLVLLAALYPRRRDGPVSQARARAPDAGRFHCCHGGVCGRVVPHVSAVRVLRPGIFGVSLAQAFLDSMRTVGAFSTGAADFPPGVQWIGRLPVLSQERTCSAGRWDRRGELSQSRRHSGACSDARAAMPECGSHASSCYGRRCCSSSTPRSSSPPSAILPIVPVLAVATACLYAQAPIEPRRGARCWHPSSC